MLRLFNLDDIEQVIVLQKWTGNISNLNQEIHLQKDAADNHNSLKPELKLLNAKSEALKFEALKSEALINIRHSLFIKETIKRNSLVLVVRNNLKSII